MKNSVIVVLCTVVLYVYCAGTYAQDSRLPLVLVEKTEVRPEVDTKKFVGMFEAIEKVDVVSRVSGYIEKVAVKEGDIVKPGDVLFEIEQIRYQAAVKAAQGRVAAAEAQIAQTQAQLLESDSKLKYAQANYERNKSLFEQNRVVTEDTLENAQSVLDALKAGHKSIEAMLMVAQAQLQVAEADLIIAEDDLKHTKILSNLAGKIGRVSQTAGNYITPASGILATVIQIDPIYLRFSISEKDFTTMFGTEDVLKSNCRFRLKLANDRFYEHEGKITFVDNRMTATTDTLYVWATFPNSEYKLIPDGVASVYLEHIKTKSSPAVKLSALMFDGKNHFLYIIKNDSTVEKRIVELGTSDGTWQTIKSGLSAGELVVIDGHHKVRFIPDATGKIAPVKVRTTFTASGSSPEVAARGGVK